MTLSRGARRLFAVIHRFVQRYGPWGFYASRKWIADHLRKSVRSVARWVNELVSLGLIDTKRRSQETMLYNVKAVPKPERRPAFVGSSPGKLQVDNFTHGQKHRARYLVKQEISRGTNVRPEQCQNCGRIAAVQAHHSDYNDPLKIEWLCSRCHGLRHRQNVLSVACNLSDAYKEELGVLTPTERKPAAGSQTRLQMPPQTLTNELGRVYPNPEYLRARDALMDARWRISAAANPVAYEQAIIRAVLTA